MGPIWGRQDPGGPHVGPMNFAIWDWVGGLCYKLLASTIIREIPGRTWTEISLSWEMQLIPWWRHQMGTVSAILALCERNPPVTVGFLLTKASDVELWCCLWSSPEQTAEQTIETAVIWDAVALIMTSLWCPLWLRTLYHSLRFSSYLTVWLTGWLSDWLIIRMTS